MDKHYIKKNTYVCEEDGVKFLCMERSDGTILKTEVNGTAVFSKAQIQDEVKKIHKDSLEAFALFSVTIAHVQNCPEIESSYNKRIDYSDKMDEDGSMNHNNKMDKLAEAYAIVEENRQAANEYAKELNYQDHLVRFLNGVNKGKNDVELRKDFDRFYDGTFTDEDIDFMIKLFNSREHKQ